MQQLMIPFDDFAPIGESRDVSATTERRRPDFYEAIQHFSAGLQKSVTKPSRKISLVAWLQGESGFFSSFVGESISRLNAICGTAAVVFSFVMISFAVIIGG